MKRVMVFSLTGLLVLALVGLAPATTWQQLNIPPGGAPDPVSIDGTLGSGKIRSYIDSGVDNGASGVWHASWINDGDEIFRHMAELVYLDDETVEREIDLTTANWYVHVNDNGEGSSDFTLTYPIN